MPIKFEITRYPSHIFFEFIDENFSTSGFCVVFKIVIPEEKKVKWKALIKELNNTDFHCRVSGKENDHVYNYIEKRSQYLQFCNQSWDFETPTKPSIVIKITPEIIKEFDKLLDD